MNSKPLNVLFLCTGNSARSILAEALINNLAASRRRFQGYSAGSHPRGKVHPTALEVLRRVGFDTGGFRSKSWEEFAAPHGPTLDFVFTVCDRAAGEECPFWPGQPMTAHWGVPDPATVAGDHGEQLRAFEDVFMMLRRRIELLGRLPLGSFDGMALRKQITEIGQQ